jgi:lipoprotein-anchoring transpeptidase ErfK/SrfK
VLTAAGDAASYTWSFGDGAAAAGATVEHVYGAGAFTAIVTATSSSGETAEASVRIASFALTLRARSPVAGYGDHLRFEGRLVPAVRRARVGLYTASGRAVASGRIGYGGAFRIGAPIREPGEYVARSGGVSSAPFAVSVRPKLTARFLGSGVLGTRLWLVVGVAPAAAGAVRVEVRRGSRRALRREVSGGAAIRLSTARAGIYRVRLSTHASPGYARATLTAEQAVVVPHLSLGSSGPSVLALEQALARLHIALAGVDSSYGEDTRDAVVAFQKLHYLPRTGAVDARFWRVLARATAPRARYPGDHVEVSKELQVLFVVRGGQVVLVSHVSTGATGNTPAGRWRVYSKVPGWLPDGMFDSSFFVGAFAIHGYPAVPFYPASHGCVRVPVWLAPRMYELDPPGSLVYVY